MIFREDDVRYLAALDEVLVGDGADDSEDDEDEVMDDDLTNPDVDMASTEGDELVIKRRCNGILDIVLAGEVRSSLSLLVLTTITRSSLTDGPSARQGLASLQVLWSRPRMGRTRCTYPHSCEFCFSFGSPFPFASERK